MSIIEVMYESDPISLFPDSTVSSVLSFCFLPIFCNLKEKIILEINSNKINRINSKKMLVCEISIIILIRFKN